MLTKWETRLPPFQPVYVQHFKCNIRDIRSGYPHLHKVSLTIYHPSTPPTPFLFFPVLLST